MNRALIKKSLYETRLLLAGSSLWLFIFCWVRVWIVSRLERGRFQAILEQLGDVVSTFSPVPIAHLLSFTGRIAVGYDDALVVLVVIAFAIARGSDVVAGELGRGSLEMLLAQPVSRIQVLWSQAIVTIGGLALLCFATWAGTWVGIHTTSARIETEAEFKTPLGFSIPIPFAKPKIELSPMSEQVDANDFAPAAVNLFALSVMFAGGASFLSSCDRYRWRAVGLSVTFLVLETVLKLVGIGVKGFGWMEYLTVFTPYAPQKMVEIALNQPEHVWAFVITNPVGAWHLGPLAMHAILAGLGLGLYALATLVFVRRDLPAPL